MTTYKILRFFQGDHDSQVIMRGLDLEQAQAHCKDPESASKSCTTDEGRERTKRCGPWFDGYQAEG